MKRIKLNHGTARVSNNIDDKTIESLNRLVDLAYEQNKVCEKECKHCGGTGWDSYPNHDTTMRPCPECQP